MKLKNTFRIEPDALKAAFRKHGTTAAEACRRMNYSPTFMSTCYSRGWVSAQTAKLLRSEVGILPEEYVIDEMSDTTDSVDYDRIYDMVLRACKTAIKEALS